MALFDKLKAKRAAGQGIFGKQDGFGSGRGALSGIGRHWEKKQRPMAARRGDWKEGKGWFSRIGGKGLGFMGGFGTGEGNLARLFRPGQFDNVDPNARFKGEKLPRDMKEDIDMWEHWKRVYDDMMLGENTDVYSSVLGGGELSGGSNPYATFDPLDAAWKNESGAEPGEYTQEFTEDNLDYDPYLK